LKVIKLAVLEPAPLMIENQHISYSTVRSPKEYSPCFVCPPWLQQFCSQPSTSEHHKHTYSTEGDSQ